MADREKENPNGSTGPRSTDGKQRSSQNSLKHGLCSEKLILPDEDPAEFEEVKHKWLNDTHYDESLLITFAEQTAVAEWLYRRALRRHNEAEQRLYDLQPDPFLWTPDQIKLIDRFQRYLTTRERAFNRAAANYERFHNDCRRLYEEANQLLEKAYDLVKENPDLAAQWIRDEVPIRLPRRFISTVVLNHPLRPEARYGETSDTTPRLETIDSEPEALAP